MFPYLQTDGQTDGRTNQSRRDWVTYGSSRLIPYNTQYFTICMEEHECANYPDFFENHQFHVIYCVTLAYVLYFEEFLIHDSRGLMILKNN